MSEREVLPDDVSSALIVMPNVRVWQDRGSPGGMVVRGRLPHVVEALVTLGYTFAGAEGADFVVLGDAMHDVTVTIEGADWILRFRDLVLYPFGPEAEANRKETP